MKARSVHFQRPFWPVSFISGLLTLFVIVALLVFYRQTFQWQYLALSGLAAAILLAHGVAWQVARSQAHYDLGIWLIASAQILSAVAVPLFLADYWVIGFFLLTAAPLEIGVAIRMRHPFLLIVLTLLSAAGMVGMDLLDSPNRLTIITDQPGIVFWVIGLLILYLAGLGFLSLNYRLRPDTGHNIRFSLTTQLSLVFTTLSTASIVVVTGVLVVQIHKLEIEQVGQSFQTLVEINATQVGAHFDQQIDLLTSLSRQETVFLEGLATANDSYPTSKAEAFRLLQEKEHTWQTSPENSPFVRQFRSNAQTLALSKFRSNNAFHTNMFLTDRLGGMVAAQGVRPARFYYGDQAWWQAAWNNGWGDTYLGDLVIDPETKIASVFIAIAVLNPANKSNHRCPGLNLRAAHHPALLQSRQDSNHRRNHPGCPRWQGDCRIRQAGCRPDGLAEFAHRRYSGPRWRWATPHRPRLVAGHKQPAATGSTGLCPARHAQPHQS